MADLNAKARKKLLFDRARQGVLCRPAKIVYPLLDDLPSEASLPAPLTEGHPAPLELNQPICADVVRLGLRRSPSHVSGFIMSGTVDPVDGMTSRTRTHSGQEFRERLESQFNPFAAVEVPVGIVRVTASLFHFAISCVLGALGKSMALLRATAAFAATIFERLRENRERVATITLAIPLRLFVNGWCDRLGHQFAKPFPGYVFSRIPHGSTS